MSDRESPPEDQNWICSGCGVPLEYQKTTVTYLASAFPVDMLRCPKCGQAFLPESLALGRMAQLEGALEDK